MDLGTAIRAARTSALKRWLLDRVLHWRVPFNRPHDLRLHPLPDGAITVRIPYWRVNRNHIRGVHACCMATAAEYCCGIALLEHVDAKRYRLIMKRLQVEYHYQAKAAVVARFHLTDERLQQEILLPLEGQESVLFVAQVELHDEPGNHIATAHITWQVKDWRKVRTKA